MKPRPAILIVEKEQLLLMRYRYGNHTVYGIPGGNPDEGESLQDALIRELQEELQVRIRPGRLLFLAETVRPGQASAHVLHCLFEGTITEGIPTLNPAETSAAAVEWVPLAELEKLHLYPQLGKQINAWYQQEQSPPVYLGPVAQPWV